MANGFTIVDYTPSSASPPRSQPIASGPAPKGLAAQLGPEPIIPLPPVGSGGTRPAAPTPAAPGSINADDMLRRIAAGENIEITPQVIAQIAMGSPQKVAPLQPPAPVTYTIMGFTPAPPPKAPPPTFGQQLLTESVINPAKQVASGALSASAEANRLTANVASMADSLADWISRTTGTAKGGLFKDITDWARANQAAQEKQAQELAGGRTDLPSQIYRGGTQGVLQIPQYAIASSVAGPVAGIGALSAIRESDQGWLPALRAAAEGALTGGALEVMGPASRLVRLTGAAAMAYAQARLQGADNTTALANAVTMGGTAAIPGGGVPASEIIPGYETVTQGARTAISAAGGAAKGAYQAATETIPLKKLGIEINVPKPLVTGPAAAAAAHALGVPYGWGTATAGAVGAAAPIVQGAIRGAREAVRGPIPEVVPEAPVRSPGQTLAESQNVAWDSLSAQEQALYEHAAQGQANAAAQRAAAAATEQAPAAAQPTPAAQFAAQPTPSPAAEQAPAAPPRMTREQRRATAIPPETGVPESVARAMAEREAIIGKPREQWTNADVLAADALRAEGYSGAPARTTTITPAEATAAPTPTPVAPAEAPPAEAAPQPTPAPIPPARLSPTEAATQLEAAVRPDLVFDWLRRNNLSTEQLDRFTPESWQIATRGAGLENPPAAAEQALIRQRMAEYESAATMEQPPAEPAAAAEQFQRKRATRTRSQPAAPVVETPAAPQTREKIEQSLSDLMKESGTAPPPPPVTEGPRPPTASEARVEGFAQHFAENPSYTQEMLDTLQTTPRSKRLLETLGRSLNIEGRPTAQEIPQIIERVKQLRSERSPAATPGPAPLSKEPWQMTRAEFIATYAERTRIAIAQEVQRNIGRIEPEIANARARIAADPGNPGNASIQKWINDALSRIEQEKMRLSAPIKPLEEIWTPAQIQWHHVEQALHQGKPVPSEVLADYPNLARRLGR